MAKQKKEKDKELKKTSKKNKTLKETKPKKDNKKTGKASLKSEAKNKKKPTKKAKKKDEIVPTENIDFEKALEKLSSIAGMRKLSEDILKGYKKIESQKIIEKEDIPPEVRLKTIVDQFKFVLKLLNNAITNNDKDIYAECCVSDFAPGSDLEADVQVVFRRNKLNKELLSSEVESSVDFMNNLPVVHNVRLHTAVLSDIIKASLDFEAMPDEERCDATVDDAVKTKGFTIKCQSGVGAEELVGKYKSAFAELKFCIYEILTAIKKLNRVIPETCECCGRFMFDKNEK